MRKMPNESLAYFAPVVYPTPRYRHPFRNRHGEFREEGAHIKAFEMLSTIARHSKGKSARGGEGEEVREMLSLNVST